MARAVVRGRKALRLKFQQLKPVVAREISAAMEANADDLVSSVLPRVPEDQGDLKRATGKEQQGRAPHIRWLVYSGDQKAFYARFVEFNRQAYFYPTYRAIRRRLRGRLGRAFRRAKEKVFR